MGKYGIMRKQFLKVHRSARYQYLMLTEYLNQVDKEAREKVEMLMEQKAEQWEVTEELKMQNQMEWVRRMNNIKNATEEIAEKEFIYKLIQISLRAIKYLDIKCEVGYNETTLTKVYPSRRCNVSRNAWKVGRP